jgi:anion-transporting  ArsA/GET3 family ATPase
MEKQVRVKGSKVDTIDLPDMPKLPGIPPDHQKLLDDWWAQVQDSLNRYARDVAG